MGDECTVRVRGTVIWMFEKGLRCESQLHVSKIGSETANLILVSRPGPNTLPGPPPLEDDVGIALLGGVNLESNVNVFMVSTGAVEIEHNEDAWKDVGGYAGYLSIYADWVRLMGPLDPLGHGGNSDMVLNHGSCSTPPLQDAKDGIVDQLIEQDLLPNSRFARKHLQFVSGSWLESSATVGN